MSDDKKRIQELRIIDDNFGRLVFEDIEASKELLKTYDLIDDGVNIIHYETQKDMLNINKRSLIFDIFFECKDGYIDVELENNDASVGRARYHSSVIDVKGSYPGMNFGSMFKNVVVFVCDFDMYKKGQPYYIVQRIVRNTGEVFNDNSLIVYINATYKGDDKYGRLAHDLNCSDPDDINNKVLQERVRYFKETKEGINRMCKIWDEVRAEGREEGVINSLKQIMMNLNLSIKDAMKALGIPEEDYSKYEELVLK